MIKKYMNSFITFCLVAFMAIVRPGVVFAGTDLTVTCANNGPCNISPAATPLFDETNMLPGDSYTQHLTIINDDTDDTCFLHMQVTDTTPSGLPVNFAQRIFAAITDGSTNYYGSQVGGEAQPGYTYQDLYDTTSISLGNLGPGTNRVYTWYATFDITAGNEYQRAQSVFDFAINITCDGGSSDGGSSDGGSSSSGGGGGDGGSAPKCEDPDMFPSAPTGLTITNRTNNSATLSWNAVSGASEYVIFFRDPSGNEYSVPSAYVGNNTTYTINNISGGLWTFEVAAVGGNKNLCASPRASITENIPGGTVSGRPQGQGGEILGTQDEETEKASPTPSPKLTGEVAGSQDTCVGWKLYIPWILLVMQFFAIAVSEFYFRKDKQWTKHYIAIGITLASIFIFYLVRECECFAPGSILVWLCKWYWLVSLLISALLKAFTYAFVEEVEQSPAKPQPKSS